MDREVALHLLSEIQSLQARMEHVEVNMQVSMPHLPHFNIPNPFEKREVSQSSLLELCKKYDKHAEMTDRHTVAFTLDSVAYTATLNEGRTEVLVRSPDGRGSSFDEMKKMDKWLAAQKGVKGITARAPDSSRLMAYTQAVLAQQGRGPL